MSEKKKYLTDPKKVRKYLNLLVNDLRNKQDCDVQNYRAQGYLLRIILDIFEFQKNLQIEERIDVLEKMMEKEK